MSSPMQLRIDGQWLSHYVAWGDLEWSTRFGGGGGSGLWEVSFAVARQPGSRTPLLRPGAFVELFCGPSSFGSAILQDPDWTNGKMVATGAVRQAERVACLDSGGNATAIPNTAVDAGINRGLLRGWTRSVTMGSTAQAATTSGLNYLHTLLDSVGDETNKEWRLSPAGDIRFVPWPTDPVWQITPGVVDLGLSRVTYASRILVRYIRDTDGSYRSGSAFDTNAATAYGPAETIVDATPLGPMSTTRATDYAQSFLNRGRARPAWLDSADVSSSQLLTTGGSPAPLRQVRAGQMVRIHSFDDTRLLSGRTYLDVVIGSTEYSDGADTIRLSPVDTSPQTLTEALAEFVTRRAVVG